jgi:hypothetical protein
MYSFLSSLSGLLFIPIHARDLFFALGGGIIAFVLLAAMVFIGACFIGIAGGIGPRGGGHGNGL